MDIHYCHADLFSDFFVTEPLKLHVISFKEHIGTVYGVPVIRNTHFGQVPSEHSLLCLGFNLLERIVGGIVQDGLINETPIARRVSFSIFRFSPPPYSKIGENSEKITSYCSLPAVFVLVVWVIIEPFH